MHVTHMHEIMQILQRTQKQCCQSKNMQMQMQAISPAQKQLKEQVEPMLPKSEGAK